MIKDIRIGKGVDIHRFSRRSDKKLFLGGTLIPNDRGLDGHSDADVLLHAITDALLGAVAKGDIGVWFPNTDPQWKDKESSHFVAAALNEVKNDGWSIANIDCNILTEEPKLSPHFSTIRRAVAEILEIDPSQVSVKASTPEKLGALGRGEGIFAEAIVLLTR